MRTDAAGQKAAHGAREGKVLVLSARVLYTDLIDASTTQSIALGTLPADALYLGSFVQLVTAFTDAGAITDVEIDIGPSGNTDLLLDALELMSGTPVLGRYQNHAGDGGAPVALAGAAIGALFTATGANFGNGTITGLDAGEVEVQLAYMQIGNRGVGV